MIIQGSSIVLRPLRSGDIEELYKWRNNPQIRKSAVIHPFPVPMELDVKWLTSLLNDTSNTRIYFGIEKKEDNRLIGYTSLTRINWINRNCYFGIVIGETTDQGKGTGQEVTKLAVNYALNFLNMHKVILEVLCDNSQALHIYKKLGFQDEGLLKEHFFWDGNFLDVKIMAINQVII
jgi:diamine N-acetyltransferase